MGRSEEVGKEMLKLFRGSVVVCLNVLVIEKKETEMD